MYRGNLHIHKYNLRGGVKIIYVILFPPPLFSSPFLLFFLSFFPSFLLSHFSQLTWKIKIFTHTHNHTIYLLLNN